MSDYELVPGDNVTVSADTAVVNFTYRGGSIEILPTVSYTFENYIFAPTSSEDPPGDIFRGILTRFALDMGRNGSLRGFRVYDTYERNKSLFFPCIVADNFDIDEEPETYFFGGEHMNKMMIGIDLAFKENRYVTAGDSEIGQRELAEFYLHDVRKKINDIVFDSDVIIVGSLRFDNTIEEPKEKNSSEKKACCSFHGSPPECRKSWIHEEVS